MQITSKSKITTKKENDCKYYGIYKEQMNN
jgi:hypothetical protein